MAEARERLQWERDALAAGEDPAEVETRRDLIEQTHNAAERLMDDVERLAAATGLMLEQGDPYDGRALAGFRAFEEMCARYGELLSVVGASIRHVEGKMVPDVFPESWEEGR